MTNHYRWVQWNRHKVVYDLVLAGAVVAILLASIGTSMALHTGERALTPIILLIRGLALSAFILLHVALAIGPLARLSGRFAPLLYNRRHLGVTVFVLALAHAGLATLYYGSFGEDNPVLAMLARAGDGASLSAFPFEMLGFLALLILFAMAATSHDFWLANLGPRFWKWLHMMVYLAYALAVGHVALGAMQSDGGLAMPILLAVGATTLVTLHVLAAQRERARDADILRARASINGVDDRSPWIDACALEELIDRRGRVVRLDDGRSVAIFRNGLSVSAVSNVCAHQGGPLGEGEIIGQGKDACVTCPWHGYQYLPENGQSPPPYTERIPTYRVRIEGRRVLLDPRAHAPGTRVEPARIDG